MKIRNYFIDIICCLFILLFVYISISKLLVFKFYYQEMFNQPLPRWSIPILSWSIPLIECVIVAGLIYSKTRLFSLYASFLLLSLFTIYILLILANSFSYIPCSCGGISKSLSWTQQLWLNLFFMALAVAGAAMKKKQMSDGL